MGGTMEYSEQQLDRLRAKLAGVKEELKKKEQIASPDIGEDSYVRVSEDAMTAWLCLAAPEDEEAQYHINSILAYLKKEKILYGIDMNELNEMLMTRKYGFECEVAHGKPEVAGKDGYYDYNFSPEEHHSPKVLPDGSVDYTSMNMLQNVKTGDILATYHHAVQGVDGYTVHGVRIRPKGAKELPPLRGRNISNADNPDVYVSLIDGKVELKNNQIDIQSTHEIRGDVDWLMGKIEFYGDIIINGNVESGVVLRAGRNIVIRGTAAGVTMYAGGDIILERGVQGNRKAKLSARGNIFSEFLEHSTVEAGGDIQSNAIISSNVSAGGKVILTGKQGRIIGGYTHGMKGISAVSAGNMSDVKTVLHAGFEAKTYEEMLRLNNEEKEVTEELQKVVDEMTRIIKSKQGNRNIPKAMEAQLPQLNKRKDQLFKKLDDIRSDIKFYQELLDKGRGSKIEIKGNVNKGVVIGIENMQLIIEKSTSFMRYQKVGGVVQGSVLVY